MIWVYLIEGWLWLSAVASAAGWLLSGIGQLNTAGYAVVFGLVAAVVWWRRKRIWNDSVPCGWSWRKLVRRLRRWPASAFAVLAVLVFLGGALYPPSMHTVFTYHIPRVLHWLAEGKWHWIHTAVARMNHSFSGMEWLSAPLLLILKTDRVLFLLNFLPLLLLPGLLFSVCTNLGVRPRVAWYWMWLFPTGYNFLIQGGTPANDTFAAIYASAAIYFGCRVWATRQPRDFWNALLAASLLTGVKATNLPLLLPWFILVIGLLPILRGRLISSALMVLLAGAVSFLPCGVLNYLNCRDWLGVSIEVPNLVMHQPLVGLWGNSFQLFTNNFVPPFFVLSSWWNQHYAQFLPHAWVNMANSNFDTGFFLLGELPTEDWAGIGFGVSVLLAVSVLAGPILRKPGSQRSQGKWVPPWLQKSVLAAAWVALLFYGFKSGLVSAARLISPYYPLLLPALICGAGQSEVIRRRWWHWLTVGVVVLAIGVVVCVPGRPLWPAQTFLAKATAAFPGIGFLARAEKVYRIYGQRSDPLAGLRELLPAGLKCVGFLGTADDIDISLWRPYGSRRVEHILAEDTGKQIRDRRIEYAVVSDLGLIEHNQRYADWLQAVRAEALATNRATIKVNAGAQAWYVVRFKP